MGAEGDGADKKVSIDFFGYTGFVELTVQGTGVDAELRMKLKPKLNVAGYHAELYLHANDCSNTDVDVSDTESTASFQVSIPFLLAL